MTYTPGPWHVDSSHVRHAINAGEVHIAMANIGSGLTEDEAISNAHLIEAAPELLEALKDFYAFKTKGYDQDVEPYNKECPVCHSDKPYHNGLCPKYKVDQAIAKAEGKT